MLFADELPQGHAIKFILIDDNQNIRKYFDGTDEASLDILKKDITNLVRELKDMRREPKKAGSAKARSLLRALLSQISH